MAEYSPLMQQYFSIKEEHKDSILFFRVGDFYEMFFDDAILASRELEITLTGKECGQEERAPMCGVPYHAVDTYVSRLIEKGYKVAICEQLEDPKTTKGMVKRDVIRIVTPGTVIESNMLDEKKNNYIMSIFKKGIYFGIAICDISTGDFFATQIAENNNFSTLLDEIAKYSPAEIVVNSFLYSSLEEITAIRKRFNSYIDNSPDENFVPNNEELLSSYNIECENKPLDSLEGFELAAGAITSLLQYLTSTQKIKLEHINHINIYNLQKYMSLDITARRNLELLERQYDKGKKGTLLWVLDKTSTSMGGRLIRRWISEPLMDRVNINSRLEAVQDLKDNTILREELQKALKKVYDIERLVGKISYGNSNGREMNSLKASLEQIPEIKELLKQSQAPLIISLNNNLDDCHDLAKLINDAIVDDPPITIKDGGIIKEGYNSLVDEYKKASTEGKTWLLELEQREKEKTGIKNLKIGFNKVFGYYLEVTKSNLSSVPDYYIRKQTLTNGERYITEELNELESKILTAEEKLVGLEYELFLQIRDELARNIQRLQKTASVIATLDVIASLATVADDMNYVRPIVDNEGEIDIKEGRHPVIEKMIDSGSFVANDTYLNGEADRLSIITGPNMAGKSTYMRQVALITLMAQIGSFVPASYAKIGIVDKIFTRVGASDDLSMGQSTFMVEMMEVANILREATKNSLIILDEIGRGTSTYDGLSIAWAVVEHITNKEKCGAKTLFATHYHELTELENTVEGVKNYSIAVKEKGEDIIFLRKIVKGGTDESYGIHVAKLAGVPQTVVKRSNEILRSLEKKNMLTGQKKENKKQPEGQLDFYNYKLAEIAHEIDKINLNELTPIDALNTLMKMKEKMQ